LRINLTLWSHPPGPPVSSRCAVNSPGRIWELNGGHLRPWLELYLGGKHVFRPNPQGIDELLPGPFLSVEPWQIHEPTDPPIPCSLYDCPIFHEITSRKEFPNLCRPFLAQFVGYLIMSWDLCLQVASFIDAVPSALLYQEGAVALVGGTPQRSGSGWNMHKMHAASRPVGVSTADPIVLWNGLWSRYPKRFEKKK
jgi:hypothetical protein